MEKQYNCEFPFREANEKIMKIVSVFDDKWKEERKILNTSVYFALDWKIYQLKNCNWKDKGEKKTQCYLYWKSNIFCC